MKKYIFILLAIVIFKTKITAQSLSLFELQKPSNCKNMDSLQRKVAENGLEGRKTSKFGLSLAENFQHGGQVVIDICLDKEGNVIFAKVDTTASTTIDNEQIDASIKAAKKYKFATSSKDNECGKLTFKYKTN